MQSLSLSQFVRSNGGVNPQYARNMRRGELRRLTEGKYGVVPGLINSSSPLTLEEMTTRCQEAGYIWNDSLDDFLDALATDVVACAEHRPRVYPLGEEDETSLARHEERVQAEEDALVEEHARLFAENARLKRLLAARLRLSHSESGAVVLRGVGSRAISLSPADWQRLLSHAEDILDSL